MNTVFARGRCHAHYLALLASTNGMSRQERDAELKSKELPVRESWTFKGDTEALLAMQESSKGKNHE